jgi:hypothetical protein
MQPIENVTSIDIIYVENFLEYKSYDQLEAMYMIPSEQWGAFIDSLNRITCKKHHYEPNYSLAGYLIRITYADGCYEVISRRTGAQFSIDGDRKYPWVRFDREEFDDFITKYIE